MRSATTAIASGVALGSLALSGHAVIEDGWPGIVHQLNDVLHVLSAGAWFGALVPLLIVLTSFGQSSYRVDAAIALRRFSAAGHVAVALTIVSGIANSLFIIGWPLGWSSTYQAKLTAKIVVVLVMITAAIVNRYWFVPRLRGNGESALRTIRAGTLTEIGLGLAAILLASVFGILDPYGT